MNLWASLVTRIFEGLAEPEEDDAQEREERQKQRRAILERLETARELKQEAERRSAEAQEQLRQANNEVRQLEDRRRQQEQALQDLLASPTRPPDMDDLIAAAQNAVTEVGLGSALGPENVTTITDIQRVSNRLRFVGDRIDVAWQVAKKDSRTRWAVRLSVILAAVLALAGLGLLIAGRLPGLVAFVGSALPIALAWITGFGKALRKVDLASAQIEQTLRSAEQRELQTAQERIKARASQEAQLRTEIQGLTQEEVRWRNEVAQAKQEQVAAAQELEDIQAGRRLLRYIADRARGAEYQRYLGIIALIRRDFAELSRLLKEAAEERAARGRRPEREQADLAPSEQSRAEAEQGGEETAGSERLLPPIDRIILYIDDLDRCPANRVVEVLSAIHLILALPLFVVVVGVDSRWLLKSLQRHYWAQLGWSDGQVVPQADGEQAAGPAQGSTADQWETTPQNYLEKIFQIPFTIRPMDKVGFQHLLGALLPVEDELGVQHPQREDAASPSAPAHPPGENEPRAGQQPEPAAKAGLLHPAGGPEEPGEKMPRRRPELDRSQGTKLHNDDPHLGPLLDMNPKGLRVTGKEHEFMACLATMIRTPRAAKRLINTYQLIQAWWTNGSCGSS